MANFPDSKYLNDVNMLTISYVSYIAEREFTDWMVKPWRQIELTHRIVSCIPYHIFVTNLFVEKSCHVEKFKISMHDKCGVISNFATCGVISNFAT